MSTGTCTKCGKEGEVIQTLDTSPPLCRECYWPLLSEIADRVGFKPTPAPYRCTTWYIDILGPGDAESTRKAFLEHAAGWPMGGITFKFDETAKWWIVRYWIDSSD